MTCSTRRLSVCITLLGCVVWAVAPHAHAQQWVSLEGRWQADPMTVRWVIGDWGEACGPRPSGGGDEGGVVEIELRGDELLISGAGRSYSTQDCWAMHPELHRQNHSGGPRSWTTTCRTQPNDSRQEILQTSITATDDVISFRESGQYLFTLKGQTCSASSGRWRTYRRLGAGAPPSPTPAAGPRDPSLDTARRAPASAPCAAPGPPAKIEVRPARKLMRAGESFAFRAVVSDARGCALRTPVAWELLPSGAAAELEGGRLTVPAGTSDAELTLVATAANASVRASVDVVSQERYAALLASGDFTLDGASVEAATATITAGSLGAGEAAAGAEPGERKWTFVALVAGIALLFGVVGAVLLGRANRGRRRPAQSPRFAPDPGTVVFTGELPAARRRPTPADATRLEPLSEPAPVPQAAMVCPICGTLYSDRDAKTCPKDSAQLLRVNA